MIHLLGTGRDASLSASAASDATVQTARMGASPQRMHTLTTESGSCCDGQSGLEPAMAERGKSWKKAHEPELVEVIKAVVSRDPKPDWAECQIGYEAILAKADWRNTGDCMPEVTKDHDDECSDQKPKPPKSTMVRIAGTPESSSGNRGATTGCAVSERTTEPPSPQDRTLKPQGRGVDCLSRSDYVRR